MVWSPHFWLSVSNKILSGTHPECTSRVTRRSTPDRLEAPRSADRQSRGRSLDIHALFDSARTLRCPPRQYYTRRQSEMSVREMAAGKGDLFRVPAHISALRELFLSAGECLLCYNQFSCGSGGTGRHTIYPYRFRNSLQTSDYRPSAFRLHHFQQCSSERPVAPGRPQTQAVGAKSGAEKPISNTHALKGSSTQLQTTTCTSSLLHARLNEINEMPTGHRSGCRRVPEIRPLKQHHFGLLNRCTG
jgi:hypothetical protein